MRKFGEWAITVSADITDKDRDGGKKDMADV